MSESLAKISSFSLFDSSVPISASWINQGISLSKKWVNGTFTI
jgi:hypothetical protein